MSNELLMEQMKTKVAGLSISQIVESFELTSSLTGPEVPVVRGVLMDEMEARNPAAFSRWMDCTEVELIDRPSRFF